MTIKTHGRMFTDNTVGITQLDITDGTANQAIVTDGQGVMRFATVGAGGSVGSSVYVEDTRTGDGSAVTFNLSTAVPYEESIFVFIDGIAQPTTAYTLPTTTSITFSSAPIAGVTIRICHLGIASSIADNGITGAKIAMGSDVAGDVLYYNGTDYQRLGIGTAGQHLTTNSSANAPEWTNAGSVVQRQVTTVTAFVQGGANEMILNDVIPTNSQGAEFMTVSITPKSATNRLLIWTNAWFEGWEEGEVVGALFQDNVVNALAAGSEALGHHEQAHQQQTSFHLTHDMVAGTTSATIFKLRAGKNAFGLTTGTAMCMNGFIVASAGPFAAGRRHGGVCSSQIVVEEYVPYTP